MDALFVGSDVSLCVFVNDGEKFWGWRIFFFLLVFWSSYCHMGFTCSRVMEVQREGKKFVHVLHSVGVLPLFSSAK